MKSPKLRMYLLVKDSVPDDYAPLMVAHAAVNCFYTFADFTDGYCDDAGLVLDWIQQHHMAKVVCRVSEQEFQQAIKEADDYIIQSETNGLDPEHLTDCVVAFAPRYGYPKCFQFFKLWKVKKTGISFAELEAMQKLAKDLMAGCMENTTEREGSTPEVDKAWDYLGHHNIGG